MEWVGFVPPVVAAPVLAPVINFVGLAVTTVAAAVGINKVVEAVTPKPPQTTVGGDVSFQPWGDDPYKDPPLPEPAPSMAPIAESTLAPTPTPPLTPTVEPKQPETVTPNKDPQAPLTPEYTPVPAAQPPGTAGRLGGYFWDITFTPPTITARLTLRFGSASSPLITTAWSAVAYEVQETIVDGQWAYIPRIRVLAGKTTKYLWAAPETLKAVPSLSSYGTTVSVLLDDGSTDVMSIATFAARTKTQRLTRTFVPSPMPSYAPEYLPEEQTFPTPEPLPEVETQEDLDLYVPPPFAPPLTEPKLPLAPDAVPLPTIPVLLPVLDSEGRPVKPRKPVYTLPGNHVVETPGGTISAPGGTARPTLSSIAKEVARLESKSAQVLKNTNGNGSILDRLPEILLLLQGLADLFEQPLPAKEYSISGVCEEPLEDGKQPSTTVVLPEERWADRLISQSDVLPDLLQAHLGYKTPICGNEKPTLEGDFRTISFRSDQTSPYGKSRLRKRLRYRSTSGFGLSEVVDHWAGFTFEAGPVCVKHRGSSWGTVTVWAATADEGKRVIRHAAGEAGFDADQDGRWTVGGSSSSRFGVSGTMRVDTTGGYYWITARDGSDARPIVAKT